MSQVSIPSLDRYAGHLRTTGEWLVQSVRNGNGGSCASFSPLGGWSKPYPETTGYLIPTLVRLAEVQNDTTFRELAESVGDWLLSIQQASGAWHGGLHPNPRGADSVFNTGQILKGLSSLYRATNSPRYEDALIRASRWLAAGVGDDGLWPAGDYAAEQTPSYYTEVAWPMLEAWKDIGDDSIRDAATRFLDKVVERRLENGVISGWGFKTGEPAYTHTIAYTIRGLQECARVLGSYEKYGEIAEKALDVLVRKAELSAGQLPGAFDDSWSGNKKYVCLTGNAQLAICMLILEARSPDLRLVNAAAKLLDFVGSKQRTRMVPAGIRGAVGGSYPLWGRYMFMRYPNWAAKYYCDALMHMSERLAESIKQ